MEKEYKMVVERVGLKSPKRFTRMVKGYKMVVEGLTIDWRPKNMDDVFLKWVCAVGGDENYPIKEIMTHFRLTVLALTKGEKFVENCKLDYKDMRKRLLRSHYVNGYKITYTCDFQQKGRVIIQVNTVERAVKRDDKKKNGK